MKESELMKPDIAFHGYKYIHGQNIYSGVNVGRGGYVYAEPGMYSNIGLFDVASLHPHSIKELHLFGDYTDRYVDIMEARIAIKHKDLNKAKAILGPALQGVNLENEQDFKQLAQALKIVINSTYGLTSASFPNRCNDPRNKNNIVALRGALFMVDLQRECQKRGWTVAHIKTDSIKIPNINDEIKDFVMNFGFKYGYTFELECIYEKMCLVNNSTYISKIAEGDDGMRQSKDPNCPWSATGAQFQHPYVFKTLFSHEKITFEDMMETKSVTGKMYLDMNELLPEDQHNYQFIGKVGQFTPVLPGEGGGILYREKDGKYYAVGGTKGYRWLESEAVKIAGVEIDQSYYRRLVDEAVHDISEYGDFEQFAA